MSEEGLPVMTEQLKPCPFCGGNAAMHIISDESMKRPFYIYQRTASGYVGYPASFEPATINWNHIDGPLMHLTNGQLHWLTYRERISLFFGWTDVHELDEKHQRRGQ